MNAAIRAVVRTGAYYGVKVCGVKRGYNGLINGEIEELQARSVSDILQKGGTSLMTARCLEFKTKEGVERACQTARVFGLDGLVVIGGDGSFRGARDLSNSGVPTIAMPGTIDNDISCTEYTVGYDTCLNTVKDAIDKLDSLDGILSSSEKRFEILKDDEEWLAKTEKRLDQLNKDVTGKLRTFGEVSKSSTTRLPGTKNSATAPGTRESVITLAHQGWTPETIANRLGLTIGEVELILGTQ
jgi:hypothetical protein